MRKILCWLGFHKWSDTLVLGDRVCLRCGKMLTMEKPRRRWTTIR